MTYEINNLKINPRDDKNLEVIIKSKYNLKNFKYKILQKSIDARDKNNVYLLYRLLIETDERLAGKSINIYKPDSIEIKYNKWNTLPPVIVGFGPAGMLAGLYLARCNAKPIIIERGAKIEDRKKKVNDFLTKKILSPNSNVQFGEGGAGAFSDGKLVTNLRDPLIKFILNEFYLHGAKEDILYDSKPHIGTDYLEKIVKNIREEIISLGGKFYFETTFNDYEKNDDIITVKTDNNYQFNTKHLLLCLGHSAKDTLRFLFNKNIKMEPKSFSMGVRIEHPQDLINESQYGKFYKYLPPAYYKLASHNNGRGVYTFCMCPGGYVIPSQSEENTIVTNGMSNNDRKNINANSALLVDVNVSDYYINNALDGINYQEKYERLAFSLSNDYRAPANLNKEFLEGKIAISERSVKTSYAHGLFFTDLAKCLPDYVIENLKFGIKEFDKRLHGFAYDDAIIIGIESRSSSPVRILRDENRMSNIGGIYPVGEGAGYAGGITSAALDGLKTAISLKGE